MSAMSHHTASDKVFRCIRCEATKPEAMFSVDRSRDDGVNRYCKLCVKAMRPKPDGWVRRTADMTAYRREYERQRRRTEPEKAKEKDRRKYVAKMKRLHGDGWTPGTRIGRKKIGIGEAESRARRNARRALRKAVARGTVMRLCCWVCGRDDSEAHHPSYALRLDVVWLCREHHRQVHIESTE